MSADTLILNLTRFGDLLQSQALIGDLHKNGRRVGLVCLDNFASALPLLRHVSMAWPLPGARLMADLDRDWRTAAVRLMDLARRIRQEAGPERVINLTPTLPARLLAKLLAPTPGAVLGFGLDAEGFGLNNGIWATFLNGTTLRRLNTPFNLVDMFRMVGAPALLGSGAPASAPHGHALAPGLFQLQDPAPDALEAADALLAPAPAECAGFVALQLGASEARRQWPARFFAALGDRLWQEQALCPVLLGAPSERPLAEAYAAASKTPFINAVGRTGIPQLAALLTRARLLVTNDTGTMHLAAGLGVPCLALFLATAQPWDTGPYLPGCCCLEPALPCHPCPYGQACPRAHACLEQISPRSVGDLVLTRLTHENWENAPLGEIRHEARVWLTEQDQHGFAALRCLSGHDQEDRSLWLGQQRLFWRQILDSLEDQNRPVQQDSAEQIAGQAPWACCGSTESLPPYSPAFKKDVGSTLGAAAQLLDTLLEQGRLTGKTPVAGRLFLLNCERLQSLLDACAPLASLGAFWRELRQQRGDRLEDLLGLVGVLAGHLRRWGTTLS